MFKQNPLTNCDSYKLGHMAQYPEGTEFVYSNFTPRSVNHLSVPEEFKKKEIIFFGLQVVLEDLVNLWNKEFFEQDIDIIVRDFSNRIKPFVGPMGFDINKIVELHKYGRLPLEIRALKEGSRVPVGVPVFTIVNTEKRFYWLTNFIETWLSAESWKMSTSATIADVYKRILTQYAEKTGAPLEFVMWQGHDFSMRGMSGVEDAVKSGAGHLVSFYGTDCLPAVDFVEQYYDARNTFVGGSVPATEHSVMCLGGSEDEFLTFKRLIKKVYPKGICSIVSDTWDFWKVITEYALKLKDDILSRECDDLGFAKVVFRPDSGDPVRIICGYNVKDIKSLDLKGYLHVSSFKEFDVAVRFKDKFYLTNSNGDDVEFEEVPECVVKGAVETLWDIFGGDVTSKGYKVLNQRVGLIYGDSITPYRALEIMKRLESKGFASNNIVLGIGSYTYQYTTRDTLGFAMKATYGVVNGTPVEIFKAPKTDNGMKKSAKGLLRVIEEDGVLKVLDQQNDVDNSLLERVFYNGDILRRESLETIRKRVSDSMSK